MKHFFTESYLLIGVRSDNELIGYLGTNFFSDSNSEEHYQIVIVDYETYSKEIAPEHQVDNISLLQFNDDHELQLFSNKLDLNKLSMLYGSKPSGNLTLESIESNLEHQTSLEY